MRVIGVGVARTIEGITIEFHSVELRGLGGFGMFRLDVPAASDPSIESAVLHAQITVTDDAGTNYTAVLASGENWNGRPRRVSSITRIRFCFVPSPPTTARRVSVDIEPDLIRAGAAANAVRDLVGRWRFDVGLG